MSEQTPAEARQTGTQEKARERFIAALETGASVAKAARMAGVGRATVYRWKAEDESFSTEWDNAYETGTDALEDEAHRRAVEGVVRMKFYKGEPVMVPSADDPAKLTPYLEHEYSDTMLAMQLNARRPEKYRTNHKHVHTGGIAVTISKDDAEL